MQKVVLSGKAPFHWTALLVEERGPTINIPFTALRLEVSSEGEGKLGKLFLEIPGELVTIDPDLEFALERVGLLQKKP